MAYKKDSNDEPENKEVGTEDIVENTTEQESKDESVEPTPEEATSEDTKPESGGVKAKNPPKNNPHIEKILKAFSGYSELYITPKGRVYEKDTKQELLGDAILYKNPFVNK